MITEELVSKIFAWFMFAWVIMAIIATVVLTVRYKFRNKIFTHLEASKIIYKEDKISGYNKSMFLARGGFFDTLVEAYVTKEAIAFKVRNLMSFMGFNNFMDIEHFIKKEQILKMIPVEKNKIEITFNVKNKNKTIVVILNDRDRFLQYANA